MPHLWLQQKRVLHTLTKRPLDWGLIAQNKWFHQTCYTEIFIDDCYQRFFRVEPGDVVLDVGASIGPFTWNILDQQPARVVCVEAHPELYNTLVENLSHVDTPVTTINLAMGRQDGVNCVVGLFDPDKNTHTDGTNGVMMQTISFQTLIEQHGITQIDFLKTDCEGGEWDMFTAENFEWITQNVRKIAGEFHLNTPELRAKWIQFRDLYLTHFDNFQVYSIDYVDIKWDLWNDHFIQYYGMVLVYIDNRRPRATGIISLDATTSAPIIPIRSADPIKKKWQHWPAPTMEITTIIPEKGCVVDCVFCPQRVLEKVYTGTRIMTVDAFRTLIDRIPRDVRITFAGFTEPWMNKYCTDMVVYAHEQGHPISVFTTGVGVSVEDLERIVDIPFHGNPNGGFTLHLPDSELLARHPITPGYLKTLAWLRDNHDRIQNFSTMTMGEVHPGVRHLFDWAPSFEMWSRAGNLVRESLLKPKLINLKDRWNAVYHEGERTCGCVEHLYHNVLLPNGDVSLCCMDYGLDHVLGNLYTQSYEDVIPEAQSCRDICNWCENGVALVK
jgi:FkbM family methyltransferase